MTHRYRESALLKVRVRRGVFLSFASCGSVTKKQKPSGPGLPFFSCLGHSPRHNKAFVPTPGTAHRVSCGFRGGAAQLTRWANENESLQGASTMCKTRMSVLLALATILAGCGSENWQPYFEGSSSVIPKVSFRSLLECQQYLHLRFGNVKGAGTMYCLSGCTKSEAKPGSSEFKVGEFNCPVEGKQIVGQLVSER